MATYVLHRLLILPVVVFGVVTVVFVVMRVLPADVARLVAGIDASEEQVESVREKLNLDSPLPQQYVSYVAEVSTGDLGKSIYSNRPVAPDLMGKFRNTVLLALVSVGCSVLFGITLGTVAAAKFHSIWDNATSVIAAGSLAMPRFWLGLVLIFVFAEKLRLLPALGNTDPKHMILPVATMAIPSTAVIARMMRATMLDVLHEDYIRTATAKGLSGRIVIFRHALKPSMLPVITIIGLQLGFMLGGSVVVETVFSYPGIGSTIVRAIQTRDFPVVQAGVILVATTFALINLAVDVSYAWFDPRIRYSN